MLSVLTTWIRTHLPQSERGQDLIEYALLGGLLATLIIAVAGILTVAGANPLETMMDGIEGCIDFQAGGCDPF